jgi:hypothetical protein
VDLCRAGGLGGSEQVLNVFNSSFRRKPESSQNNCLLDAVLQRHDGNWTNAEFPLFIGCSGVITRLMDYDMAVAVSGH